jgi:hypothetical protein
MRRGENYASVRRKFRSTPVEGLFFLQEWTGLVPESDFSRFLETQHASFSVLKSLIF